GLLKRHGLRAGEHAADDARFMSTSHLAALPVMTGVDGDGERRARVLDAWEGLLASLGPAVVAAEFRVGATVRREGSLFGDIDGAVLFAGRVREALVEHGAEQRERDVLAALGRLLRAAERGEPVPYYAILLADGDRMGAVIDAQRTFADHRALSIALDELAQEAL